MLAFSDVARESAETDGLVELVFNRRDEETQPAILSRRGTSDELMPELTRFLRAPKSRRETVAFGNDAEDREKRVADNFFGMASEKFLPGEVHARHSTGQILGKDHVGGLFDEVSITRREPRSFEQARDFRDQAG